MSKKEKEVKEKKPFYKRWWFIALVIFIVIGAVGGDDEQPEEVASENTEHTEEVEANSEEVKGTEEPEEEQTEEPTYDTYFEQVANDVFGESLTDFSFNADEGKILATVYLDGGWSENSMKRSFYTSVLHYAEQIQGEDFVDMYVDAEASMVDQYGNAEDEKILTLGLTKETIEKINFERFNTDNTEEIADAIFVHPAFQ